MAVKHPYPEHDQLTRREVAGALSLHPDSVSRLLLDGLGAAVLQWGGHSKPMTFSGVLFRRWLQARRCISDRGGPCRPCRMILEDCACCAQHLAAEGHGAGQCDECFAPWLTDFIEHAGTL